MTFKLFKFLEQFMIGAFLITSTQLDVEKLDRQVEVFNPLEI